MVKAMAFAAALLAITAWSPAEEANLSQGRAVARILEEAGEAGPGGRLQAAIDIPAPPALVWRILLDCERAPLFVPNLRACRILETAPDGAWDVREHRVRWLAFLPEFTLRFRATYVAEREIRIASEGGDFAEMNGVWRLEPLAGEATRLHYDVRLTPNRFIPSGLVRSALLRDTPKVLEAVRAEALRTPKP